jgi:hypothetical protein
MKTIRHQGHRAAIALVVIGFALTIAAWGPSSKPSASSSNHSVQAFKRCMRAHGVPMNGGSATNPNSPSFKAAKAACAHLLPGFARTKAQMLEVSRCMRQHGISNFPNPTVSLPPNSNPARAVARSGVILAIPSSSTYGRRRSSKPPPCASSPPKEVIRCTGAVPSRARATSTPHSAARIRGGSSVPAATRQPGSVPTREPPGTRADRVFRGHVRRAGSRRR